MGLIEFGVRMHSKEKTRDGFLDKIADALLRGGKKRRLREQEDVIDAMNIPPRKVTNQTTYAPTNR